MNIHTFINCFLIFAGAIIMLISIIGAKQLVNTLHLVPDCHRRHIRLYLIMHRALMGFFLLGYLVVLAAFVFQYSFISDTFVSLIFFFGAIFVFVGVNMQSRLLSEVQSVLRGILTVCCKCNKVRTVDTNPQDPMAWKRMGDFLSEKINVDLSHGYCPECYAEEIKNMQKTEGK